MTPDQIRFLLREYKEVCSPAIAPSKITYSPLMELLINLAPLVYATKTDKINFIITELRIELEKRFLNNTIN